MAVNYLFMFTFGLMVVLALCIVVIYRGVGFKNFFSIFKAKIGKHKGAGHVYMFGLNGIPKRINVNFETDVKGGLIQPNGEKTGLYVFKKNCMYYDEYDIPSISYMVDEADPIDPRSGLITKTSPTNLDNIVSNSVKAFLLTAENELLAWLKKNWWVFVAIFGGIILVVVWFNMGTSDQLTLCIKNSGKTAIYNLSQIGK
jgi:hypothetical protein